MQRDVERVARIWGELRERNARGPFLFGDFTVADAYYAPVVSRFATYGIHLPDAAKAYADFIGAAVDAAMDRRARAEREFVVADEPYRLAPERADAIIIG